MSRNEPKARNPSQVPLRPMQLAWSLGYRIAVPLVVLALLGRFIDRSLQSSPLFLFGGIIISIAVSTAMIYREARKILMEADNDSQK